VHGSSGVLDGACHALVLEDDRAIAQLFVRILKREGITVEWVENGSKAIECLASDRYNLLVLDLLVPDHGDRVIEYVKHHRLDLLKSIIVVSAQPTAIRAALSGAYPEPICKFIAKPFDTPEFVRAVHACKQLCNGDVSRPEPS